MKAIIYCRKSTDREEMQQNSISHQINNCLKTAQNNNLKIEEEIVESKSAKEEYKREWFNSMIDLCKKWWVSFIIIDEPKRLSRNNIDTSRIIDLMDKKLIKWILATSREYRSENSRDKFLLQLDLSLSKMDNEDRAKDILDKMISCAKDGKVLGKVPFWYKNVLIKKWVKDVVVSEEEKKLWNQILSMVVEWIPFKEIAKKLYPLWLKNKLWKPWSSERLRSFITHDFYRWFTCFRKELYEHKYPLIFDLQLLEEANKKISIRDYNPIKQKFPLKTKIKTNKWEPMVVYVKKWNIYYRNHKRKINISENIIIQSFWEFIESFIIPKELEKYLKKWLLNYYKEIFKNNSINEKKINKQISQIREKKEKLMELFYAWWISVEWVKKRKNEFEKQKFNLDLELSKMISVDDACLGESLFFIELFTNLYKYWKTLWNEWKIMIMDIIISELFIDQKKSLRIQSNELFEIFKICNFSNGGA